MAKARTDADPSVYDPEPVAEADPEDEILPEEPVAEEPVTTEQPEQEEVPERAPIKSDPKTVWVDYAVALGEDRADVETWTKADIIEVYG